MPVSQYGQEITFASQLDPDQKYTQYVYVRASTGQNTITKILAAKGHPEMVSDVLVLNASVKLPNGSRLRSANQKLKAGTLIRLPGTLAQQDSFSVLCGDERPIIKDGYAMYDTINRPGRVGLKRFLGYNPLAMDIQVQFEGLADQEKPEWEGTGVSGYQGEGWSVRGPKRLVYVNTNIGTKIEGDITKLERMAGRGDYQGNAQGPPAVIRVSVTDNNGNVVPLIPRAYQWNKSNPNAPLYRITAISWGSGAISDSKGNRVRQQATITVEQYTAQTNVVRSATQRNRAANS